jgi:arylsulfatase A-like enzyme
MSVDRAAPTNQWRGGGLAACAATLIALSLWADPVSAAPRPATEGAPDIVVVMVDDLGRVPGDPVLLRLPNIRRRFIREGTRVTNMHSETPLCCPGRATFQTGQHTLRHGVVRNDGDLLDPDDTLNVALRAAGYYTFMVGKYYNRYGGPRVPPGWSDIAMRAASRPASFWVNGDKRVFPRRWVDEVVRTTAVRWLSRAPRGRPAFGWVSFVAPHVCARARDPESTCYYEPHVIRRDRGASSCRGLGPFRPPSYSIRTHRYETKPMPRWPRGWKLTAVCESMLVVDRAVRDLIAAQRERERPAYFVFLSDNGMAWGQHGFSQKHVPLASRLPFYVAGAGIGHGARLDGLVSNIDIAPTLAEAAGVRLERADGTSMLPWLRGEGPSSDRPVLMVMPSVGGSRRQYPAWRAVQTHGWRYVRWATGKQELYDTSSDPWMRANLAHRRPGKAVELRRLLGRLLETSRP